MENGSKNGETENRQYRANPDHMYLAGAACTRTMHVNTDVSTRPVRCSISFTHYEKALVEHLRDTVHEITHKKFAITRHECARGYYSFTVEGHRHVRDLAHAILTMNNGRIDCTAIEQLHNAFSFCEVALDSKHSPDRDQCKLIHILSGAIHFPDEEDGDCEMGCVEIEPAAPSN